MWEKIPKEHRRQFLMYTFLSLPASFILGLLMAGIIVRFVWGELTFGSSFITISVVIVVCIWSVIRYYRKLTRKDHGQSE